MSRAAATLAGERGAVLLALAGAAILHLLLFQLEREPAPRRLWGDEIMYADLAERAARGEPAEVELLWPPLYPRLLAQAARLGPLATVPAGTPPGAALASPERPGRAVGRARAAVALVQIALLLIALACLRPVAARLTGSPLAADLAAALALVDPHLAAFAHYLWPEALHLALLLGALALLVAGGRRLSSPVAAGALLGLALLTKSLLQPFLPVLVAPLVVVHGWRRGLARAALVLAVTAAVVAPTIVANGRRTGAYVIADAARFNLWVGLNDRAPRNFTDEIVGAEYNRWLASAPAFSERQAILSRRLAAFVEERSLTRILRAQLARQYFRLFGAETFLTDQLPGGAIAATGYGYVDPPRPVVRLLRAWSHAHYALVLVAASFGLVLVFSGCLPGAAASAPRDAAERRHARAWLAVVAAFLAYNLAVFLFLHVKTRYRVPLTPFLEMAGGLALAELARRARGGATSPASPTPSAGAWALTGGALLAALLLTLAFVTPRAAWRARSEISSEDGASRALPLQRRRNTNVFET